MAHPEASQCVQHRIGNRCWRRDRGYRPDSLRPERVTTQALSSSQQSACPLFDASLPTCYPCSRESLDPGALITFLNDYLGHMTLCVERCHGMVDKFIGDAVMAVFSLPVPHPDTDAERAVLAALMMRDELERFNRKLSPGTPHIATGIGLHTGPVVAGLIGSPQKRSYTVIGDAVNTA